MAEGRMEEAAVIAEELKRMSSKLEEGGYENNIPTDMANILGKPVMATGGRVGLESGGNPLDKMKMGRRGFLGLIGGGLAALATGGKGLFQKVQHNCCSNSIDDSKWYADMVSITSR